MAEYKFNPNEHLMQLQGKDYLEVKWRLVWFRNMFPNGSIETEMLMLDLDRETEDEVTKWVDNPKNPGKKMPVKEIKKANGFAVFRSVVKDGQGGIGTGTKSEKAASFPDFIEKAESGSIGRALAALGFGTQFTGDDLNEHHRIVDAPVDRSHDASNGKANHSAQPSQPAPAPSQKQSPTISQDAFKALYGRGKEQGLFANPAEFAEYVREALGLDAPIEFRSRMLTEDEEKDIQDSYRMRALQSAQARAKVAVAAQASYSV